MKNIKIAIMFITVLIYSINCQTKDKIDDNNLTLSKLTLEKTKVLKEIDGFVFRDLNKNNKLDKYEDYRETEEVRLEDLLSQMTLEDKAGMMFIHGVAVFKDGKLEAGEGEEAWLPTAIDYIDDYRIVHCNYWGIPEDPKDLAIWNNNAQLHAENANLGIPFTFASDPRHHNSQQGDMGFSFEAKGFTAFCELIGFGAIRDENLIKKYTEIIRKEYLAVGIREALHPQIDLATEPRWPRVSGTFGEDAELSGKIGKAYISVLQGKKLGSNSVACMTKHFPGGGPQKYGFDPHFHFQQGQYYPGNNFDYHMIPFKSAFEVNTSAIMPYYGVPTGQTPEDVAMSFNKTIITDLLRNKYKFNGIICTDWGLVSDIPVGNNVIYKARAWGVEHLTYEERVFKIIDAGCDQLGGEYCPEIIIKLIKDGKLSENRIDLSIRRLLKQKFELGLFDNPFVDESKVDEIVGKKESREIGYEAQKMAMTLLKNEDKLLPLQKNKYKVFIKNIDSTVVSQYANVVLKPEDADFAIIRLNTPWKPHKEAHFDFAKGMHHGDLDFKGQEKEELLRLLNKVPTIVNIYLDRPAVIPDISRKSKALIADFGASDMSVCEVLFGNSAPKGRLPFELPSSMEAVRNQKTDVPYDSKDPLFEYGFGLLY